MPGFFARLEQSGIGLNLASLIGHNTVRERVMGSANRQANPEEIAKMQALVAEGMRAGAVGFSTGLIYIPGTYASTEEVVALAKAAAPFGGIYASHMRDEGVREIEAIEEAAKVGREAGMRVELAHFKIDNTRIWGSSSKSLALLEKLRREGVDITVDQYPYDRASTGLGILLPSWALADSDEKINQRLKDKATRAKIAAEMRSMLKALGHKDFSYAMVASCEADHSLEGKDIARISLERGRKKLNGQIEDCARHDGEGRAPRWFTTPWATKTSSASCATRTRPSAATAACASSAKAFPTRGPTEPTRGCWPNSSASARRLPSRTPFAA